MVEDGRKESEVQAAVQHQIAPRSKAEELEMIYRDHHKQVFQAAYRVTGNATDAEDVMQTIFVRLLRRDRGKALSQSPSGYLHRAAVNAALDVLRSRKSARATALDDVEPVLAESPQKSPERIEGDRRIRERVREALTKLNPKTAEVFALRYFEGYGNNEIARMLGTSRSTVAVMLHRARNRLKDEIREFAGEA
jgi:RNA polymerase sigma-70 factor (ECF subfamily)